MDLNPSSEEEQIKIKSKIYSNLKKQNIKFSGYEEIIKNYQKLMEKYNNARSIAENTYYNRSLLIEEKGKIGNMNQSEILKNLRGLQNELEKTKIANQEYLENSNKNLKEIMNLKNEKEKIEKEYSQLKPQYDEIKSKVNEKTNEKKYYSPIEETNIPKKLKFNYKIHLKEITSLSFSNYGQTFLTTGGDNIIKLYETSKNKEILTFSNINTKITDACFDNKDELIFTVQ